MLAEFVKGYLETAIFADSPEGYLPTGRYREGDISISRVTKASRAKAIEDCKAFLAKCGKDYDAMSPWDMGSNFWYTRNGHGVGFWDRDLEETGDRLTDIAQSFGECHLDIYRGWIYLQ